MVNKDVQTVKKKM